MEEYYKLTHKKKFIGSQPITFNKYTYNKNIKYYVTHKLDGLRKLLLLSDNSSYLISTKMEYDKIELPIKSILNGTLLDCEYYKGKIYVFDILFISGKDIRKYTLKERITEMNKVVNLINSKKIILKKYYSPYDNNICINFFDLLKKYSSDISKGEVDGIIFSPDESYDKGIVLKWKPIELLSIDFKIKKIGDNKIELLTQKDELFKPKGKYSNIGIVKLKDKDYNNYNDGDVIEFILKNNKFVPLRARYDKVKSNHIKVIMSNFKTILNPPNMEKILCI